MGISRRKDPYRIGRGLFYLVLIAISEDFFSFISGEVPCNMEFVLWEVAYKNGILIVL